MSAALWSARPVAVLGGGGHARVVIEALRRAGASLLGVVDPKDVSALLPSGIRYIGATLANLDPAHTDLAIGVGSVDVGAANPRPRLYDEAKAAGFVIRTVCHPSAILAADVTLGEGAQIMAGAVLQPGIAVGANSIINTRASLDHDCRIGDHVHVAPGAVLSGGVQVGSGTHIGTGAVIIQGIRIAEGAMIPAGAVVTRDVAAGTRTKPERA